jgi:rubrerythrin
MFPDVVALFEADLEAEYKKVKEQRKSAATQQTVKVAQAVHGRWVYDRPNHYKCSECDAMWSGIVRFMNFCPNCGQPMDAKDMDVPTKDGGVEE